MSYPKIRDITLDILTRCGITAPPVELERILAYFRIRVQESNVPTSALLQDSRGWLIRISPKLRDERRSFRIAHEIAHVWWSDSENHRGDPSLGGRIEHYCSKFASLLLCPHQWFVNDAPEADRDLFRLKAIYPNVSYEVLTIRLSYLGSMVVTILDNGKLYRRFGTPGLAFPKKEQKIESEVYEAVDLYGEFREARGEVSWAGVRRKVRVRGYPVFSPGFRRIILTAVPGGLEHGERAELEEDMPYPFPEY